MKNILKLIFIINLLNYAMVKANSTQNPQLITIKKIWILKRDMPESPWKSKIIPEFLDFTKSDLLVTRGYSDESMMSYDYKIVENCIILKNKLVYTIVSLSIDNLVIKMGEDYYSYYILDAEHHSNLLNETKTVSLLLKNKKWQIENDILEFTNDKEEPVFDSNARLLSLISYYNNRRYLGTYFIDIYKGHVFLHLVIVRGQVVKKMIELLDIDDKSIKYKDVGNKDILISSPV